MSKYEGLSDSDLLHLLKEENRQALSELHFRYWQKMIIVACNRFDDIDIAQEIVQDVFFSIWQRRHTLELRATFSSYLATAVKYMVIKKMDQRYREKKRILKSEYSHGFYAYADPEELFIEKELMAVIEQTVKQLPEKCRIVFRLSRETGLSNKQIAAELDISEKTVEAHMSRALKDIRQTLTVILLYHFLFL